jgi:hypothetical protein
MNSIPSARESATATLSSREVHGAVAGTSKELPAAGPVDEACKQSFKTTSPQS